MSESALPTPLFDTHRQWGGKLVEFAGYRLPLSYADGGLLAEHLHTRQAASLFDVSHMGQVSIRRSEAAAAALMRLMPANAATLPAGRAKYTVLTNESGGVIDDCIITGAGDDGWFIVINAARKQTDITHLRAALTAAGAADALREHGDRALLALQGPQAADILAPLFPAAAGLRFMQSLVIASAYGDCRVSRCGYTGEDGFEIAVAADQAAALAGQLLSHPHCKPAGLGARDSLRLEAGLCLYGNELDESISPIEAGLLWTIPAARRQADAGYLGAEPIAGQIAAGAARVLRGLLPQGKTPVRHGADLQMDGAAAGIVTSGVYSPTLSAPIALALIDAAVPAEAELTATVRGREIICRQTALPFVPHRYHRG